MNSRERVRTALAHREPDRLPLDFGGTHLTSATPEMQARIAHALGLTGSPDPRFRNFDDRIQRHFGCDLRLIRPNRRPSYGFTDVSEAPLRNASLEDCLAYAWPKPEDDMFRGLEDEARFLAGETGYAICASQIAEGIFETGCYLRGYDQILYDMAGTPEWADAFFRKVLEVNLALSEPYFRRVGAFVDLVLFGDDLAMQDRAYVSPAMFDELVKPYYKRYVECIRSCCPRAAIVHHCCGSAVELFGRFRECGVQAHNPVQTTARNMAPELLAREKPRMAFLGGLDLQHILPHGTADEVRAFVKNLIAHLAPGGGFILAPCHTLPDDVKPENLILALRTAQEYGSYPIKRKDEI